MREITVSANFYEVIEEIILKKCFLDNLVRPQFMNRLNVCISGPNAGKVTFTASATEKVLIFMALLDLRLTGKSPHRVAFLEEVRSWFS